MIKYCLEIHADRAIIHKLDCPGYDLGTLLGLGCVADLGEFKTASQALDAIKRSHPHAIRCHECCQAEVVYLPHLSPQAFPKTSDSPSG